MTGVQTCALPISRPTWPKRPPESLAQGAAQKAGLEFLQDFVLGQQFADALLLAFLGDDEIDCVALLLPGGDFFQELTPGFFLGQ